MRRQKDKQRARWNTSSCLVSLLVITSSVYCYNLRWTSSLTGCWYDWIGFNCCHIYYQSDYANLMSRDGFLNFDHHVTMSWQAGMCSVIPGGVTFIDATLDWFMATRGQDLTVVTLYVRLSLQWGQSIPADGWMSWMHYKAIGRWLTC